VINVGGTTPTLFTVCSVQDFSHLTLCSGPANQTGQNAFLDNQNINLSNLTVNSNGQALGSGDGNRAGIFMTSAASPAFSTFKISNITAGDAQNSPTQLVGVSIGGNTRGSIVGLNATGNVGSSICAGSPKDLCDNVGKTAWQRDDGAGEVWAYSNTKVVTANVTNSTTTMANITGMSWNIAASKKYVLRCDLIYQSASTGGLKIAFTGPASPTQVEYCLDAGIAAGADARACTAAANTSFATVVGSTAVTTATTNWNATLTGSIENGTTAGVLQIQFASVAAVSTIIERDSSCTLVGAAN
jgi:hypothetical protein